MEDQKQPSLWARFQRWGRTPFGEGVLVVILLLVVAATVGLPTVVGD